MKIILIISELIIVIILSISAFIIVSEWIKYYDTLHLYISLLFVVITLIIGLIIIYLIHNFIKLSPIKKDKYYIILIKFFYIIISIIGLLTCIIIIVVEEIRAIDRGVIYTFTYIYYSLAIFFLIILITFFISLRHIPFIKEKETEITYGIPPKYVRRTKKQRVDLKNVKYYLDSYEELIGDNPNGISNIIKENMTEKIKQISDYYSKLNNNWLILLRKDQL
ncbi:MAG: hypothetical protein ACFFAN_08905 [Promethearchaeota archaeon]